MLFTPAIALATGFKDCFRSLRTLGEKQQTSNDICTLDFFQVLEGLIPNLPESLECLASGGHSTMVDTKVYNWFFDVVSCVTKGKENMRELRCIWLSKKNVLVSVSAQ